MVAQAKLVSSVGLALRERGKLKQALQIQKYAADLDPQSAIVHVNLGVALQDLNHTKEAIDAFSKAVLLSEGKDKEITQMGQLNHCLATLRLKPEFLVFNKFLIRWQLKRWPQQPYDLDLRHWLDVDNFKFERLLVMPDQGYGDNLMALPAIRWFALQAPGKLNILVKKPLLNFYKVALKDCDVEISDHFNGHSSGWLTGLDILGVYSSALSNFHSSRDQIEVNLRQNFESGEDSRLSIALCWRGNPSYELDKWRKLPMNDLLEVVKSSKKNLQLLPIMVNLQIEEVEALNATDLVWHQPVGDFLQSAKLMLKANACWTADSACVHLAGLCGVATWVGVSAFGDWRWPDSSGPCYWYPDVKVVKQVDLLNWDSFVSELENSLKQIFSS